MHSRLAFAAASVVSACLVLAAIVWMAQPEPPVTGKVEIYIGNIRLSVPSPYIRFEHARLGGRLPELDLIADAKTFRPIKTGQALPAGTRPADQMVFFTVTSAAGSLSPVDRTTRLYSRFLEAGHWNHPGGLILRRFQSDSPYQNEDLYIAPPEGRRFAARCQRPRTPPDGLPETCLTDMRVNGIDIRLRFDAGLLPEWEKLYNGTRGLMQSFRR